MQQIDAMTSKNYQSKYNYYNLSAIDSDSDQEMGEDRKSLENPEEMKFPVYHTPQAGQCKIQFPPSPLQN